MFLYVSQWGYTENVGIRDACVSDMRNESRFSPNAYSI